MGIFKTSLKIEGSKLLYFTEKIKKMLDKKYEHPKCQRSICEKRVKLLLDYYKKDGFFPLMPLIFCIFDGKRYIVDGQHRARSYGHFENKNIDIPILTIEVNKKEDIKKCFRVINQNVAVSNALFLDDEIKNKITEVNEYFNKKYSWFFKLRRKGGRRPNRPQIEKEEFQNKLSDWMQNYADLKTSQEIIDKLEEMNIEYSTREENWFPLKGRTKNNKMIQKIKDNGNFYFGMLSEYEWVEHINKGIPKLHIGSKDKKIPKTLRNMVWNKWIGRDMANGKCYCCKQGLNNQSWEAGHIIARSMGGPNNINNLRPICSDCNKSMGNKHMNEFIKGCGL